jgi:uncharacterized protein with LGFP repeats
VPGYPATYQTFVQGVIVFTNDHGAVYLTQAIFDKWQSLTGLPDAGGTPVYNFFGVPTADYVAAAGHDDASFTAGMIVVQGGVGRVIYGSIYLKYLKFPTLGAPTTEEAAVATISGARFQLFAGGEIYWHGNVAGGDAMAILNGPILDKFHEQLGPSGTGLPIMDTADILAADGITSRGLVQRFVNSGIYFNLAAGTTFMVQTGLDVEYDYQGGPNGWLGFPLTPTAFTPNGKYTFNDFEHGTLVWYDTDTSGGGYQPLIAKFGNLTFQLSTVQIKDTD